ncbi:MAG TPA: TonB-dependent receptor [Flavobacterium sp.]|jgi:iron complex outermembrane receptor protein|nr:TonB-dependent receptor [Flavobacterium sp.]
MTAKKLLLYFAILLCQLVCAQHNVVELNEVVVSDRQLRKHSSSKSVLQISDSIIDNNNPSLSSLLNYNSTIYFKESGSGMVSSPSFRGTTAQQTAVIWNGININSQFNGQTDFNSVPTSGYSDISIRAGGGSAIYGSSAIGGSIHLNNEVSFGKTFSNEFTFSYGSFNTFAAQYDLKASTDRLSIGANFSRNSSDNDFEFVNGLGANTNGQFYNNNLSTSIGYRINNGNTLRFFSNIYDSRRHFSLLTPTDNKTRYEDFNVRNLVEWITLSGAFSSIVKAAFIVEEYKYFESLDTTDHDGGTAETIVTKYDGSYSFGNKMVLNGIAEYTSTSGRGTDITSQQRNIGALSLLLKHQVTDRMLYEISIRKEAAKTYQSPFLFAAGAKHDVLKWYSIRANISRNFRIPTFNDLYWSDGGNSELMPETSYQGEIGNDFTFKNGKLTINGYYIKIEDMIQWLPGTTTSWLPRNVNKVNSYGGEVLLSMSRKIGANNLSANATYAYTISENEATGFQLIYVPFHKATASIGYNRNRLSATAQMLFTGEAFTRSDNNTRYNVDSFIVSNLSAEYNFGSTKPLKIGLRLMNLFNEDYQLMIRREAPGRNFNLYLNFNI